jgi:glycosyltransferase involved in cell wall biosynthesis
MRILVVSQYFWPESFRINDVVHGLRERGHEITVLTGIPNYPEGRYFRGYGFFGPVREDYEGIPVVRVPLLARGNGGAVRLALNYLSFVVTASLLAPLRLRGKFDAILVYEPSPVTVMLPAILLRRLRRVPVLFWVQDLWPESLSATGMVKANWILALVERMVRFIYRRSDRILIQSQAFREQVQRLGGKPDRIVYLPNSAETFYRPVELGADAEEGTLVPEGFLVMFAGNIGAAQSFGTVIEAATLLRDTPEIQWVVLGDGRMRDWAETEVGKRGLADRVHFLGRFPPESMPRFFALADALLVTLRRDPVFAMTVPSKLQSYLACGRPIVGALDGEGARVLEEAQAGIACPADDARALADAVLRLYRMPEAERARMGERGRAYFEAEFERGILLHRLERCIQETVSDNTRCAS